MQDYFLFMLIYNDFWVQRVAKDEGSRFLINPTALLGACEIDKIEKFLLTLTYKKVFGSIGRQHFKACYELNNSAAFAFPTFLGTEI